jgi:hypothetical protein
LRLDLRSSENVYICLLLHTDKIENQFFPGAVAKSYMRKGFLIYEEMRKYFPIYEEAVIVIYDFATAPF